MVIKSVDDLRSLEDRDVRLPRALLAVLGALGFALGWAAGRFPVALGWVAGRAYLVGAFWIEAVIFGFRQGAMLPPRVSPEPPERADNSKVLQGMQLACIYR